VSVRNFDASGLVGKKKKKLFPSQKIYLANIYRWIFAEELNENASKLLMMT
jgi:hypothetical protein